MAPTDMERILQRGWVVRCEERKDPVTGAVLSRTYTAKKSSDPTTVAHGDSLYELLNRVEKYDNPPR